MADNQEVIDLPDTGVFLRPNTNSTSVTGKKQGGSNVIIRFFNRQNMAPKETRAAGDFHEMETGQLTGEFTDLAISPCPFIRPLGQKLQARSEPFLRRPAAISNHSASSAITIARNRGETSGILTGRLSGAHMDTSHCSDRQSYEEDAAKVSICANVEIARHREYVAIKAAPRRTDVMDWRLYIKCYSEVSRIQRLVNS